MLCMTYLFISGLRLFGGVSRMQVVGILKGQRSYLNMFQMLQKQKPLRHVLLASYHKGIYPLDTKPWLITPDG